MNARAQSVLQNLRTTGERGRLVGTGFKSVPPTNPRPFFPTPVFTSLEQIGKKSALRRTQCSGPTVHPCLTTHGRRTPRLSIWTGERHWLAWAVGALLPCWPAGELGSALAQDATPAPGSTEANKAIVLRVFEDAINTHNPALVYELYAPEFVDRSASPGQLPGPAGIEQALNYFNTILPDVEVTVDASIAEDDLVATQETWRGTDSNNRPGSPG